MAHPMNTDAARRKALIPDWYDDLDGSLAEAWRLLVRGAADRRSPIHTIAVATIDTEGRPSVRTVVLRAVDPDAWRLRFHTDLRSRKLADLARQPTLAILAYHPQAKIQLRLDGRAHVLASEEASPIWAEVTPHGRECYRVASAPGTPISSAAEGAVMDADGRERFCAVDIEVESLEWLYLAAQGHRRARFRRRGDGSVDAGWLVP